MKLILLVVFGALFLTGACGGGTRPQKETGPGPGPKTVTKSSDSPQVDAAPVPTDDARLTEVDCERMLDHILQLAFEDKLEDIPDDQHPTNEDFQATKDTLRPEIFRQCIGAERHQASYDCTMKSTTADDMRKCLENPTGN